MHRPEAVNADLFTVGLDVVGEADGQQTLGATVQCAQALLEGFGAAADAPEARLLRLVDQVAQNSRQHAAWGKSLCDTSRA